MTHDFTGAPCLDQWELFTEATHPADHNLAAQTCKTQCPLAHFAACAAELRAQLASPYHTPAGTWAGQLFNEKGRVETPRRPGRPRKKKAA